MEKMVDESCSNMEKIKETVKEIFTTYLQQKGHGRLRKDMLSWMRFIRIQDISISNPCMFL